MTMKTLNKPNREGGFTLIELMIALVLTLFLAGGVLMVHLSGRQASVDAERISRMQENIRFASDYMVRDIRNAGFRDETFLRTGHETQIREEYARLDGGDTELTIRYAGRGHCTEAFDEFRLVENHYFLVGNELRCAGRAVARDAAGATLVSAQAWSPDENGVGLIRGVTGLGFQLICPDGGTTCECDLVNDFDTSCIGVRIGMQMEGPQSVDGGVAADRSVELIAAFRNIIIERMNSTPLASE